MQRTDRTHRSIFGELTVLLPNSEMFQDITDRQSMHRANQYEPCQVEGILLGLGTVFIRFCGGTQSLFQLERALAAVVAERPEELGWALQMVDLFPLPLLRSQLVSQAGPRLASVLRRLGQSGAGSVSEDLCDEVEASCQAQLRTRVISTSVRLSE